jgi:hypothetical protein
MALLFFFFLLLAQARITLGSEERRVRVDGHAVKLKFKWAREATGRAQARATRRGGSGAEATLQGHSLLAQLL